MENIIHKKHNRLFTTMSIKPILTISYETTRPLLELSRKEMYITEVFDS